MLTPTSLATAEQHTPVANEVARILSVSNDAGLSCNAAEEHHGRQPNVNWKC
jgi:hypothetical protein